MANKNEWMKIVRVRVSRGSSVLLYYTRYPAHMEYRLTVHFRVGAQVAPLPRPYGHIFLFNIKNVNDVSRMLLLITLRPHSAPWASASTTGFMRRSSRWSEAVKQSTQKKATTPFNQYNRRLLLLLLCLPFFDYTTTHAAYEPASEETTTTDMRASTRMPQRCSTQ